MKAAYCIAALDEQIKLINDSSITEADESKKIAINNLNAQIKRMQLYLLPRLPNIELTGIMIAKETARADVKKATNELKPCILACGLNHFECIEDCCVIMIP